MLLSDLFLYLPFVCFSIFADYELYLTQTNVCMSIPFIGAFYIPLCFLEYLEIILKILHT